MKTILEIRQENLDKMLDILSKYFVIDKNLILTSKAEEYVNARYILVKILCDNYSDRDVMQITELSKSGVNRIKNKFADKEKYLLDSYLIIKKLFTSLF